jgi:hypothetical protein
MTEAVLVACVGSTLFMVGLTWFVQVVHYPLFSRVDPDSFPAYHEEHSARTTWVVAAPMLIELASSVALALNPPDGLAALATVGAALAIAIWVVTLVWAVPAHSAIGREGLGPGLHARLQRASLIRTWLWTLHGAVVLAMVVDVIDLT